jgi:hypothetical protein
VPVWHKLTSELVKQGKLVVVAVAQEQHPDRMKLFMQWHQIDWPTMVDSINLTGVRAVPIIKAIDEHGVVRMARPKPEEFVEGFVNKTFAAPGSPPPLAGDKPADVAALRKLAESEGGGPAWRNVGDALYLWGGSDQLGEAIDAYRRAVEVAPADGPAQFRLGVCYRSRFDSPQARPGDFQTAVSQWARALDTNPDQYIWRRRIQQYGPRLDKPYAFYDWVAEARRYIVARGDKPVALNVEPYGSELAGGAEGFVTDAASIAKEPDPQGKITRDRRQLVVAEATVVPASGNPVQAVHVHILFRPDRSRRVRWENEAGPLEVWVNPPPGWSADRRLIRVDDGKATQSAEDRVVSFELGASPGVAGKPADLEIYGLYYVCEDVGGTCQFLRQDLDVKLKVK